MATIPRAISRQSLDTGNVVRYPTGSPVGEALSQAGGAIQGIAARWQQQREELDNFKLRIGQQELDAMLAGDFQTAQQTMAADASGFHDSFAGQIDPETEQPIKPGIFDERVKEIRERLPESVKGKFDQTVPVLRKRYSNDAAAIEYGGRQAYYRLETGKMLDDLTTSIGQIDPNDVATYEAFRIQGEQTINATGLPELEKEQLVLKWREGAAEAVWQALAAQDPEAAKDALGITPVRSGSVVDRIIGVESGGRADAKNPKSSATGLGQFTSATWMRVVKQYEPQLGDGKSRAEVLALRNDPAISRRMTTYLAQENGVALEVAGLPVRDGTIYLAHFAGAQGARDLLTADPSASAESVLGSDVVKANPFLAEMSAGDVVKWADRKMGSAVTTPGEDRADPRFRDISFDRRLTLANQAQAEIRARYKVETEDYKEAKRDITKDGYDLMLEDGLTKEWVEANRDILNVSDYKAFTKSLMPDQQAKRTPPAEYVRLLDLADSDPEQALEEVRDLYVSDIIAKDVFNTVSSKARANQKRTGGRNFASELRSYVSRAMTPEADAPQSLQARKLDALFSLDDWIEKNPNADREQIRKQADILIEDFRKIRYASGVTSLPLPRFSSVSKEAMDQAELDKTRARTAVNLQFGKINEREAAEQAAIIRRWSDIIRYRD